MSDSLHNLPTHDKPALSEDFARVQPYLTDSSTNTKNAHEIKFYAFITILFVLLSLPFWNKLGEKIGSYVLLAIKIVIFIASIVLYNKYF